MSYPVPPYKQVMVFIDGGYVRGGFKKLLGHERIDFRRLANDSARYFIPPVSGRVTRIYYYDAIVDASDDLDRNRKQSEFFHSIALIRSFEVKLGRLVKTGSGDYRQKGVDILISIDMLTKAFQNFYDIAVFIGGDDDFVDLVNAVKRMTNKEVCGIAFQHNASQKLLESFDISQILTEEHCKDWQLRRVR